MSCFINATGGNTFTLRNFMTIGADSFLVTRELGTLQVGGYYVNFAFTFVISSYDEVSKTLGILTKHSATYTGMSDTNINKTISNCSSLSMVNNQINADNTSILDIGMSYFGNDVSVTVTR